jgi:hypothetical protein
MRDYIIYLLLSALVILSPVKMFLIIISLFVLFDTIFAIYTTIKLNGLSSFRSNKLFNIVIKTFFYMGTIMLSFLIDKSIFEGVIFGVNLLLVKCLTLLFCYIELKSIDETSIKFGNKSIWVLIKELINKGKELKKDLEEVINDDNNSE